MDQWINGSPTIHSPIHLSINPRWSCSINWTDWTHRVYSFDILLVCLHLLLIWWLACSTIFKGHDRSTTKHKKDSMWGVTTFPPRKICRHDGPNSPWVCMILSYPKNGLMCRDAISHKLASRRAISVGADVAEAQRPCDVDCSCFHNSCRQVSQTKLPSQRALRKAHWIAQQLQIDKAQENLPTCLA